MKNLQVKMRSNDVTFFEGKDSLIGLDWKEIKRGRILFAGRLKEYKVQYAPEYEKGLQEVQAYMLNPDQVIKFSRIRLAESSIVITRYSGVEKDKYFTLRELKGKLNNLQVTSERPITRIHLNAKLYGHSHVMVHASFNEKLHPKEWDVNFVLEKMLLPDLNKILKNELPFVFKAGVLDVYGEAQSKKGHIEGYLKPFLSDVVIDENDPDRKNPGHTLLSFFTKFYKDEKFKNLSTRIPLIMDGPLKLDYGEILKKVYEKGLDSKETRGLENSLKY